MKNIVKFDDEKFQWCCSLKELNCFHRNFNISDMGIVPDSITIILMNLWYFTVSTLDPYILKDFFWRESWNESSTYTPNDVIGSSSSRKQYVNDVLRLFKKAIRGRFSLGLWETIYEWFSFENKTLPLVPHSLIILQCDSQPNSS